MTDTPPTADELETQVELDVANGVSSFSDGTHSVSMVDPKTRLDVVDRKRRADAVANSPTRGLRFSRMRPGDTG